MMSSAPARVNPAARLAPPGTRKIPFAFRADPVALDDLRLDPTARQVFTLVLDNARNRGMRSRLSNVTMGRILGRCPMTISRALGRLEAAGLVRRELIAGGRIRTGIAITWEEAQRLTGQAPVRREDLTGSARASEGLGASADLIRSPTQSERSNRPGSPSMREDSDAASRVATGPEAAAYLRACVEAGRKGQAPPPPPGVKVEIPTLSTVPPTGGYSTPPTPPNVRPIGVASPQGVSPFRQTPPLAPLVPPDAITAVVGRMVGDLAERFKAADCGRRRVGPARLAKQLAELRRRHGRRE